MQDLRTVILLRRQLNHEQTRRRPWLTLRRPGRWVTWRRGWYGLLRFPAVRIVRITATAAIAGIAMGAVATGTTAAVLAAMAALYLLGLEVLEPVSQEIDHGDRTDQLPVERSALLVSLLAPSLAALVPFALVGGVATAVTVTLADGPVAPGAYAAIAILTIPVAAAGVCGSVYSVIRDAPDPLATADQQAFLPPEVAGFSTAIRTVFPLALSTLGVLTVLFARAAHAATPNDAAAVVGGAVRGAIAATLLVAATVLWAHRRDRVRAWWRRFTEEGKNYTNKNWS
jgi:hypothetical protein